MPDRPGKLPIGIQTCRKIPVEDCRYVDKTGFVLRLVKEGTHYFLSRPPRFGKGDLGGLRRTSAVQWTAAVGILGADVGCGSLCKVCNYVKLSVGVHSDHR